MADSALVPHEGFDATWDPHNRWLRLRLQRPSPMSRDEWGRAFDRMTALVPDPTRPFHVLADCRGLHLDAADAPRAIAAAYIHARRHQLPPLVIAIVADHHFLEHAAHVYFQLTRYAGACFHRVDLAEAWLRAR